MEKETKVLLWGLFSIAVMSAGFIPVAWNTTQRAADQGVVSNANLAQALWGQSSQVPPSIEANTQYPQATDVSIIPGAIDPQITSVQWDASSFPPTLTILGSGFGNPPNSDQLVLTISDGSRGWMANNTTSGVIEQIASWTNNQIVVSGFVGYGGADTANFADGLGSFVFAPGDQITVSVTNPQTGSIGAFQTQYPIDAPMPVVTVSSSDGSVQAGHSVTIMGTVTFHGQPLANQAVNLMVPSGAFFAQGGTQATPTDFMVSTDANDHYVATFTAPNTAGDVTVSAMADSITANTSVNVITPPMIQSVTWNTSTWPPQVMIAGQYLGSNWQPGDINVVDTTRQWGVGAVQYTLAPSSGDHEIDITNMSQYGGGGGQWIFAPGDAVQVTVRNLQTNLTSTFDTTYPNQSTMPTVSIDPLATIAAGQSETLSGAVSFAGMGLANQTVTLNWSGGNVTNGASTRNGQTVTTDGSGRFSVTYTAPVQPGTYTVSASSDTGYTAQTVQVSAPTVSINSVPAVGAGQIVTITGHVTGVGGTGIANQVVTLSARGGQINPQTVTTDASGNFTATYTAPGTGGTDTITAQCDGGSGTTAILVRGFTVTLTATGDQTDNNVTLTATVNQPLNGYTLRILDQTTGQTLAQTSQGTSLNAQITMQQDVTNTFVAQVN
ncbi:MAG: hypothetical protein ACYCVB_13295 [Bacilli bacterium]